MSEYERKDVVDGEEILKKMREIRAEHFTSKDFLGRQTIQTYYEQIEPLLKGKVVVSRKWLKDYLKNADLGSIASSWKWQGKEELIKELLGREVEKK